PSPFWVNEDVIILIQLFALFFGRPLPVRRGIRDMIRVYLPDQLAVRSLDLVLGSALRNAQDAVSFVAHGLASSKRLGALRDSRPALWSVSNILIGSLLLSNSQQCYGRGRDAGCPLISGHKSVTGSFVHCHED